MSFFKRSTKFISPLKKSGARPPLEGVYVYVFSVLVGYAAADLGILSYRDEMLPTQAPPARPVKKSGSSASNLADLRVIRERNIFNPDGLIPPPLQADDQPGYGDEEAEAVLSQLPLGLEGTIVHLNPAKSVATITLKNRNETVPFSIDEEVEGLARITKIERRKVTFRNLRNQRLEYIEIPKDTKLAFGFKQNAPAGGPQGEVVRRGEFDFQVKRSDINKYTSDLSSILSQARMVPNIVPGTGGGVEGFRFVSIQPGSIYEKLGFKPMDVIKNVNGEPVNSPTKAMELYNALKKEGRISLQVERNGRLEDFSYDISD